MIQRIALMLLLLAVAEYSVAYAVICETDFQSPPDNWYASPIWTFSSSGASFTTTVQSWSALLFTQEGGTPSPIYFVPDGTDSVLIEIPYSVYVYIYESASVHFTINAFIDSEQDVVLWSDSYFTEGAHSSSGTIEYMFDWSGAGWLGFFFDAYGGYDTGCGMSVTWLISGITATAYGSDLELTPLTWGSIKSSLN